MEAKEISRKREGEMGGQTSRESTDTLSVREETREEKKIEREDRG